MLKRALPYILLAGLTLLFFYQLAFTNKILARGDAFSYFYPYWDVRSEAFRAGQLPLWSPDIFMGVPLLADPQVGTLYPPNWLVTPFTAPDAIRISVLMHIFWAAVGTYLLFKHTASQRPTGGVHLPALIAAVIFAFSGFMGAHVEQINQLQGLAWLPWLVWLLHRVLHRYTRFSLMRNMAVLMAAWALQIFSGHTQTVFITGATLGMYALSWALLQPAETLNLRFKRLAGALGAVGLAALGAGLLALPQLLPTLELTGMSNRGGSGFTAAQATAFSLPPSYLGRGLLPSYDGLLFGEYIGYIGIVALGLGLWGAFSMFVRQPEQAEAQRRQVWGWGMIALVGVLFALGRYTPLYWTLAELPGFSLFRVPARWLVLWALALALLAGYGTERLANSVQGTMRRWHWGVFGLIVALLVVLMGMTRFALPVLPEDVTGSAVPTTSTLIGWGLGLAGLVVAWLAATRLKSGALALGIIVVELFAASLVMPYHDVTPSDVYNAPRFSTSQLQAYEAENVVAGRVLSIGNLYFDPGDKASLEARFRRAGLDDSAIQTAFTAIKKQEMLAANLPLKWHVPSIDGYGGGILPTLHYTQFTSLLMPEYVMRTVDGRLGEALARVECRGACLPSETFLRMTDTRYLITDKIYDVWHAGIAYDTTFIRPAPQTYHNETPFEATEIHIVYMGEQAPEVKIGEFSAPTEHVTTLETLELARVALPEPLLFNAQTHIEIVASDEGLTIAAVTLVDARTGDFDQLVPVGWQRILSSDIKLYEAEATSARATVVYNTIGLPDDWQGSEDALVHLRNAPDVAVIHDGVRNSPLRPDAPPEIAEILDYRPNYVRIRANAKFEDAYLLLADAWYPGWSVQVNGSNDMPVYRANVMFRAVPIPKGTSEIIFVFDTGIIYIAFGMGGVFWILWLIVLAQSLRRRR